MENFVLYWKNHPVDLMRSIEVWSSLKRSLKAAWSPKRKFYGGYTLLLSLWWISPMILTTHKYDVSYQWPIRSNWWECNIENWPLILFSVINQDKLMRTQYQKIDHCFSDQLKPTDKYAILNNGPLFSFSTLSNWWECNIKHLTIVATNSSTNIKINISKQHNILRCKKIYIYINDL